MYVNEHDFEVLTKSLSFYFIKYSDCCSSFKFVSNTSLVTSSFCCFLFVQERDGNCTNIMSLKRTKLSP